jgi:hypothetical protein
MRPQFKLTTLLVLTVIAFTAIGTVSHEYGHAFVSRMYGLNAEVHFAFTTYPAPKDIPGERQMFRIAREHEAEVRAGHAFPGDTLYYRLEKEAETRTRNVIWGGPAQTMLTGTLGLLLIGSRWRRFRNAARLTPGQWLLIFLTLFWLRQPANLITGAGSRIITGETTFFDDESRLAYSYGLPEATILIITTMLAAAVCTVVYRAIPRAQRGSFLLAFIIGAPLGFVIWLSLLGPVLMP